MIISINSKALNFKRKKGSGALPGKIMLGRIVENNKIEYY